MVWPRRQPRKKASPSPAEAPLDEIDRTLLELGLSPAPVAAKAEEAAAAAPGPPLLAIELKRLRADEELRRIFGGAVLAAAEAPQRAGGRRGGGGGGAPGQRGHHHSRPLRVRGGVLIRAKPDWPPPASGTGLSMALLPTPSDGGAAQVYTFTHASTWHAAQAEFDGAVASGDPRSLVALLGARPYHVGALLSLSSLYSVTNEAAKAADCVERALFAFEMAWHASFASSLAAGTARLDGRNPANAPFFDALFRHAALLSRKGCATTSLEVLKLCLSLDASDPRGCLCSLDYHALRAGQAGWLLRFAGEHGAATGAPLPSLPGWALSLSLAQWTIEQEGREAAGAAPATPAARSKASPPAAARRDPPADERLRDALLLHPALLRLLTDKLCASNGAAMDASWSALLASPPFEGATSGGSSSLEHLYALCTERCHVLWKPAPVLAWLKACGCAAAAAVAADPRVAADWAALRSAAFPPSARNAYAHLRVADFSDAVEVRTSA